jgi:FtsZ-binding cell division protein ZapB
VVQVPRPYFYGFVLLNCAVACLLWFDVNARKELNNTLSSVSKTLEQKEKHANKSAKARTIALQQHYESYQQSLRAQHEAFHAARVTALAEVAAAGRQAWNDSWRVPALAHDVQRLETRLTAVERRNTPQAAWERTQTSNIDARALAKVERLERENGRLADECSALKRRLDRLECRVNEVGRPKLKID